MLQPRGKICRCDFGVNLSFSSTCDLISGKDKAACICFFMKVNYPTRTTKVHKTTTNTQKSYKIEKNKTKRQKQ